MKIAYSKNYMYQYIKILSMCVSVCLCVSNGSQVLDYTSDAYDFHTYVTLISRYSNDNAFHQRCFIKSV